MLSKLLCAKRRKSHNSTKYCESIIKSAGIKQMAIQHHRYDQHLSQFWKHLVKYFRTGRPIQTNNSNCIGAGRTTHIHYTPISIKSRLLLIIFILQRQLLSLDSPSRDCHLLLGWYGHLSGFSLGRPTCRVDRRTPTRCQPPPVL